MVRMMSVAVGVLWPPAAIGAVLVLTLFSQLRTLALDQITNTWGGTKVELGNARPLLLGASGGPRGPLAGRALGHRRTRRTLGGHRRRHDRRPHAGLAAAGAPRAHPPRRPVHAASRSRADTSTTAPGPVPVQLVDVGLHLSGHGDPCPGGISLTVEPGQFVAVVGPNGSGKSTLARILGGRTPTVGRGAPARGNRARAPGRHRLDLPASREPGPRSPGAR